MLWAKVKRMSIHQDPATGVARQGSLRARNLSLVARHVFAAHTPPARTDVAKATGMTRSTASRMVDDLVAAGIVGESTPAPATGRGRPATPLHARAGTFTALGLEINVGHCAARLVDLAGNVMAAADMTADNTGPDPADALTRLASLARQCLEALPAAATLAGIQLAVPGLVDRQSHMVLRAPNLGWHDVDPRPVLRDGGLPEIFEVDFGVVNEADCAAIYVAHERPGHPGPLDTFLYLSGEIGIGSALVVSGSVSLGPRGWAGEIGHTCIDPAGPRCSCGATGCLERYAGTRALTKLVGVDAIESVRDACLAGEAAAVDAVHAAGRALGLALANAGNLLDITTIVLGGDLALLIEEYRPFIEHELDTRLLARPFTEPRLLATTTDHAAPAFGAAYVGLDRILDDPARWTPSQGTGESLNDLLD